jgi:hypothetical protein
MDVAMSFSDVLQPPSPPPVRHRGAVAAPSRATYICRTRQ